MSRYVPIENRAHGDELRAQNRDRIRENEKKVVDQFLYDNCQDILLGQCQEPLLEHRVDELFVAVKKGLSGHKLKVRHNHLALRLQQAARLHNLDLPNQQRMIVLHSESAPVTPAGFEELANSRKWVEGFWADVEDPGSLHGADQKKIDAGRLLFSLIVFGGVHSKKKLERLVETIPNGVRRLEKHTWMDIDTGEGLWRWYPDPVSMLLLKRWYKSYGQAHWPSGVNTDVARLVFGFLKVLHVLEPDANRPNVILRKLIGASATRDATRLEGVFHHIQRSNGATVSLPADAWERLLSKKIAPQSEQKPDFKKAQAANDLRPLTGRCDSDAYAGVRTIQSVLKAASRTSKKGGKDTTYQQLSAIAEDESWAPIVRVLASWAAHLRRYGGRQKRLVISSVQSYLATIAKPLVTILSGDEDLNALGEDEWQNVYERLLSSAPSGKRRANRAVVAGWFHEYLAEQFGMPEVEIEGATVNGEVDANILTPAEYVRAQNILQHSDASSRLTRIREIVFILGFRCGLRRSEVQKMLIKDLQGLLDPASTHPELLTRSNKFAGQKSISGTRRLPLWAMLTDVELNQLRDWYRYRLTEPNTKQNDLLFSEPQRGGRLIPQRDLFTPIQEAMRIASGTDTLRFHHLRHSCVTFVGLRLLERRPCELMKAEWAQDDSGNIVIPRWGHDIFAIANRSPEWTPTRKKLWFLSILAGHASPGQTLRSYMHLMDYVIGVRQSERRLPALNLRGQANLLGLSPESVEVFRNRNGLKGPTTARELAVVAQQRWPAGVCHTAGKNLSFFEMPDLSDISVRLEPEPHTALMIYDALLQFNRMVAEGCSRPVALHKVAEKLDLAATTIEAWLDLGERMVHRYVRRGSYRTTHSQNAVKTPQTVAYKEGVGGSTMPELPECPAPPKSKQALGLVEVFFEGVRRWFREDSKAARTALQIVNDAIQRSGTQISFTSDEDKRIYLELVDKAGAMHLARVRVRAPERGIPSREVKAHWSDYFKVPKSRVVIASEVSKGDRFPYGSAQIEIRPEPKLGQGALQHTMHSLRFAVFTLMLSCASEDGIEQACKVDEC